MVVFNWIFTLDWKILLELSALILGLVNGVILLWKFIRDRPILSIEPVHPEVYQWFFPLPPGEHQGRITRRFGFLLYIGVCNKGVRDVAINSWHLKIKSINGKYAELKPLAIPEPHTIIGNNVKSYPVLGIKTQNYDGHTLIKSGDSLSGFSYYLCGYYGDSSWNPLISEHKIKSQIIVTGVFGNSATKEVILSEISIDKAKMFIPDIDTVHQDTVQIIDP
jgi:hypothetical protein